MANYANQVIGYALADTALKNSSKSSCAKCAFWFLRVGRQQQAAHPCQTHFTIFCLVSASLATLCKGFEDGGLNKKPQASPAAFAFLRQSQRYIV
ncbi:MAG: hypothetical protein Q7T21_08305 [Gallionella sp.]|nr:hypothetical protein [Gallionella sp.]